MSGYNDLFLCEGCSLVSQEIESFDADIDSDCACTCCWYQYIQNYCFKQLCSDLNEFEKLQNYTNEVCHTAPIRASIKPYQSLEEGIELFLANNKTLYRSLLSEERKYLYDVLGSIFDFDTLPKYEDIYKRQEIKELHDPENDSYQDLDYEEEIYSDSTEEQRMDDDIEDEATEEINYDNSIEDEYLEKRTLDKIKLKLAFSEGIASLRDIKDEITFDLLQDLFESFVDNPNDFFMIVKSFLGEKRYKLFAGAYQESVERLKIQQLAQQSNIYCLEQDSKFLAQKFSDIEDHESSLEIAGCFMNTVIESIRGGHCPTTEHCSCKCAVTKGLVQCIESYGKGLTELIETGKSEAVEFCGLYSNENYQLNSNPQTEEQIEKDLNFLSSLKPIANSLKFENELAEIKADFIWETVTRENIPVDSDISAAIVIDKCELDQGEMRDYLQFNLDSCDIRGLYECKNHYKGTKCREFQKEQNVCNNACCLQIQMTECSKSHCASKKPVKEFMKIANLVCTKYADSHLTNGVPPYEDYELGYGLTSTATSYVSSETSTISKDCGEYENRPAPTRTDNVPDLKKRETNAPTFDDNLDIEALFKLGNNEDDKIARLHNKVCIIEEFKPPYDTTGCNKKEVKDCIKEGIQTLKNDPEHFCPYCVNDNVYDECRCACCFGKYFSKVCYDPNCKVLKEKLRYKRYVKEVCKTKPIDKYKRNLNDLFIENYNDADSGVERFKSKSTNEKYENSIINSNIFNSINHADELITIKEEPINLHRDLLKNMQISSLRTNKVYPRSIESDARYLEEIDNISDRNKISQDSNELLSKRSDISKKKHNRYLKAKLFAKHGTVNNQGKVRLPSTFSPSDRKLKPSSSNHADISGGRTKVTHRRRKPTARHPVDKRRKKSKNIKGPRRHRVGESTLQSKLVHSVNQQYRGPEYYHVKQSVRPSDIKSERNVPKLSTPLKIYKRDVLYKADQVPTNYFESDGLDFDLFDDINDEIFTTFSDSTFLKSSSSSSSKKYLTIHRTLTRKKSSTLQLPDLHTTDYSTSAPKTTCSIIPSFEPPTQTFTATATITTTETTISLETSTVKESAIYTETLIVTSSEEITIREPTTSTTTEKLTSTTVSTERIISTESLTVTVTENVSLNVTHTIVESHITTLPITFTSTEKSVSTLPHTFTTVEFQNFTTILTETVTQKSTIELPGTASIYTEELLVTVTSTHTRFRPTTEVYTEYEETYTEPTTLYDGTLTTYVPKTTLYRYKDSTTETETDVKTDTTTKIRTKFIPFTTVTEYEESDQTVTKIVTSWETEVLTWYESYSTATLTTYSGTLTTTQFKWTKYKFKKIGTTTETTTETEYIKTFRTKWYPEYTVTEFEEVFTKYKTKWYPYTTTDHSTSTTTTTTTTTQLPLTSVLAATVRPTPPGINQLLSALPNLIGRDYKDVDETYIEVVEEVYELDENGDIISVEVQRIDEEDAKDDDAEKIESNLEEANPKEKISSNDSYSNKAKNSSFKQTDRLKNRFFESSSNRPEAFGTITLFSLGATIILIAVSLFMSAPSHYAT